MGRKKVIIIGSGIMGCGIAIAIAKSGFEVIIKTRSDIKKPQRRINRLLHKYVEKGAISEDEVRDILAKLSATVDLGIVCKADFVIEAVVEDINVKKKLFKEIDVIAPLNTILATNTSSLSINEIASETSRPERVIGMHFFNPAPEMKLVEVVLGKATCNETISQVKNFLKMMDKEVVVVNDTPGFVVNRLLIPMINEAAYLVIEKVASPVDIDKAMQLGAKHPIGPLALADLIGLDVCTAIMETLNQTIDKVKYKICPLLTEMVKKRELGRKTGKGFYRYDI